MGNTCNEIAELFHNRNGANKYAACIKVFEENNTSPNSKASIKNKKVETLIRDNVSLRDREKDGFKEKYITTNHYISGNTCFSIIVEKSTNNKTCEYNYAHYINNNLVVDPNYKSTSFKVWGTPKPSSNDNEKYQNWTLPYRSELVVPIAILKPYKEKNQNHKLNGFLCVDCNNIEGFQIGYDEHYLQIIAEEIYELINKIKQKYSNEKRVFV